MNEKTLKATSLENYIRVFKENWLFIIIAILVVLNLKSILNFFKSFSVSSQNAAYQENTVTVKMGGKPTKINLTDIATGIYNAFHKSSFFGWFEDEKAAIGYLKQCPKSLVPQLAETYARVGTSPRSLYADFQEYLSEKDYQAIKPLLF